MDRIDALERKIDRNARRSILTIFMFIVLALVILFNSYSNIKNAYYLERNMYEEGELDKKHTEQIHELESRIKELENR